jgi:hypothetical protein
MLPWLISFTFLSLIRPERHAKILIDPKSATTAPILH